VAFFSVPVSISLIFLSRLPVAAAPATSLAVQRLQLQHSKAPVARVPSPFTVRWLRDQSPPAVRIPKLVAAIPAHISFVHVLIVRRCILRTRHSADR
jgi:hypothetical protein